MKLLLNRKKSLQIIVVAMLIVVSFLALYLFRKDHTNLQVQENAATCKFALSNDELPFFVDESRALFITPDETWKSLFFQPYVSGFYSDSGKDFVQTEYINGTGDCIRIDLLIGGSLLTQDKYNHFEDFSKTYFNGEYVSYDFLESTLKVGTRIRVPYLAGGPKIDQLSDQFCKKNGFSSQYHCTLQEINEKELSFEIQPINIYTDIPDKSRLFVGEIYTDLYSSTINDQDTNYLEPIE